MKKKQYYQIILLVTVGVMYCLYIFGIAKAISFLDNETLLEKDNAELASGFLLNDKLLIGFGVAGFAISILFFVYDTHPEFRFSLSIRVIVSIVGLAMTAYLLISLITIRDRVFALSPSYNDVLYELFNDYKDTALYVMVAQFILSFVALGRSIYGIVRYFSSAHSEEKK